MLDMREGPRPSVEVLRELPRDDELTCATCGGSFERTTNAKPSFCSPSCRAIGKRIREAQRRLEKKQNREQVCMRCRKTPASDGRGYCEKCRKEARAATYARYDIKRRIAPSNAPMVKTECYVALAVEMIRQCPRNEDCATCIVSGWCRHGDA